MKTTVSQWDFSDAFKRMDRMQGWTIAGLDALYNWLESECDSEHELDVIALCCEFCEYSTAFECATDYSEYDDIIEGLEEDVHEEKAIEFLCYNTTVIEFDGGFVVAGF